MKNDSSSLLALGKKEGHIFKKKGDKAFGSVPIKVF